MRAALAAGDLFEALGARAALGRPLTREDDRKGGERGRRAVVRPVAAAVGRGPRDRRQERSLWAGCPTRSSAFSLPSSGCRRSRRTSSLRSGWSTRVAAEARGAHFLQTAFRLGPGVSPAAARADLAAAMSRLAAAHPDEDKSLTPDFVPLLDEIVGESRRPLWILAGAVGMVLLIACANLANLLLARAASRKPELAIRTALGAPRARLVRQMLTESLVLAVAGGACGMLIAVWGTQLLIARMPSALPRLEDVTVDGGVAAFTTPRLDPDRAPVRDRAGLESLLCPIRARPRRPPRPLGQRPQPAPRRVRRGGDRPRDGAARRGGPASERAVAPADGPAGLRAEGPGGAAARPAGVALRRGSRADGVPGAGPGEAERSARRRGGMVSEVPLTGRLSDHNFLIEGRPPVAVGDEPELYSRSIMGDYFGTMRVPLKAGRDFYAARSRGGAARRHRQREIRAPVLSAARAPSARASGGPGRRSPSGSRSSGSPGTSGTSACPARKSPPSTRRTRSRSSPGSGGWRSWSRDPGGGGRTGGARAPEGPRGRSADPRGARPARCPESSSRPSARERFRAQLADDLRGARAGPGLGRYRGRDGKLAFASAAPRSASVSLSAPRPGASSGRLVREGARLTAVGLVLGSRGLSPGQPRPRELPLRRRRDRSRDVRGSRRSAGRRRSARLLPAGSPGGPRGSDDRAEIGVTR